MTFDYFQVDSFTNKIFQGNPACVVRLQKWFTDDILLNIAKENAVAETAFFIEHRDGFHLRWFTPDIEIDLCGHATLATAFVLKSIYKYSKAEIKFKTMSGDLTVICKNDFYFMNLPSRIAKKTTLPKEIELAINIQPVEVLKARDYLLVFEDEQQIRDILIDRQEFDKINLGYGGVIVTSKSKSNDFVSRFFTPQATILEDPVTGSAHCTLVPYWYTKLNKISLKASQLSKRGGEILCKYMHDRVQVGGQAVLYSSGKFTI
tara:strand:- start:55210 stop:55995 length:786 start_codon:yes stop_codon:yes gene_type:complete